MSLGDLRLSQQVKQTNKELRQMSLARRRREMQLLVVGVAALVALVLAASLWHKWRVQRRHVRQLYRQNLKLLQAQDALGRPSEPAHMPDRKADDTSKNSSRLELYSRIREVLEHSPEIFQSDFSISRLASMLGTNTRYVSEAINEHGGCGFPQLVNSYRVREACRPSTTRRRRWNCPCHPSARRGPTGPRLP